MRRLRVYADTSIFGGCMDDEFSTESQKLFDEIKEGRFSLVVSPTTALELQQAPRELREMVAALPAEYVEVIEPSEEIDQLRDAYLVHLDKIRGYHGVNLVKGYEPIPIHTPKEVVEL